MDYGRIWSYVDGDLSMKIKTICESCAATFVVVHELDEDDYIEQFCPFCGHGEEVHEEEDEVEWVENRYEDWN